MLDDPKGAIAKFYNNPAVQKALNVQPVGQHWLECMPGAGRRRRRRLSTSQSTTSSSHHTRRSHRKRVLTTDELPGKTLLAHDEPESVVPYVADLLDDAKIRVLIYNGDRDMTTNSQGSEQLLDNMIWSGSMGWNDASHYERGLWITRYEANSTTVGGYMKQYKNLQFQVVVNSGHLVPYNAPQTALELITRFLANESFIDKVLPKFDIPKPIIMSTTTATTTPLNMKDMEQGEGVGIIQPLSRSSDETKRSQFYVTYAVILIVGFFSGYYVSRKIHSGGNHNFKNGYETIQSAQIYN